MESTLAAVNSAVSRDVDDINCVTTLDDRLPYPGISIEPISWSTVHERTAPVATVCPLTVKVESILIATLSPTRDDPIVVLSSHAITDADKINAPHSEANILRIFIFMLWIIGMNKIAPYIRATCKTRDRRRQNRRQQRYIQTEVYLMLWHTLSVQARHLRSLPPQHRHGRSQVY